MGFAYWGLAGRKECIIQELGIILPYSLLTASKFGLEVDNLGFGDKRQANCKSVAHDLLLPNPKALNPSPYLPKICPHSGIYSRRLAKSEI